MLEGIETLIQKVFTAMGVQRMRYWLNLRDDWMCSIAIELQYGWLLFGINI